MCMNLRRFCACGRNSAHLSCRDNLLPAEILLNLFCPECRPDRLEEDRMIQDCGWVLDYDVERAQAYFGLRGIKGPATPAFIFDEGYLSWQGLAPGDLEVNARLHRRLAPPDRAGHGVVSQVVAFRVGGPCGPTQGRRLAESPGHLRPGRQLTSNSKEAPYEEDCLVVDDCGIVRICLSRDCSSGPPGPVGPDPAGSRRGPAER